MAKRPHRMTKGSELAPLPHQMRAQCPQCERNLPGIPYYNVAVCQSTRTCPKCHTTWRILATPIRFGVTKLEWLAVEA